MSEDTNKAGQANDAPPPEPMKLVVIILDQPSLLDDLLTGFLDLGVPGATVLESRGMGQIVRQDMPMFAGLADMFGESTGSRLVLSVMPEKTIDNVFALVKELTQAIDQPNSMIVFALPVDHFRQIRN